MTEVRETTAWEYHWLRGYDANKKTEAQLATDLQAMGREGWEAAGIHSHGGSYGILLKRELPR